MNGVGDEIWLLGVDVLSARRRDHLPSSWHERSQLHLRRLCFPLHRVPRKPH